MMTFKRVTVKKNERGLLLRNGDFQRVLQPGTHWLFTGLDALRVETFALEQAAFTHGLADYLMAMEPQVVEAEFVRVELTETQVGLRSENGVLVEVLPPATRRLYWRGVVDVQVEVIDQRASVALPAAVAARLAQPQLRPRAVTGLDGVLQVEVPETGAGLLRVDGKVERLLNAGCSSANSSTRMASRPANSQCVPGCSTRSKSPLRSRRPRSFFFTVTRLIFMGVLLLEACVEWVPLQRRPRATNAWARSHGARWPPSFRKAAAAGRGCEAPRARRTSGRR